jgi:hypothetical protein
VELPFVATDLSGSSSALIQQILPTTQLERGWVEGIGADNIVPIPAGTTGITVDWTFYILFTATVTGVTGISANQSGTIAPGAFEYALYADVGFDNTYTPGSSNAGGGTLPSVTDNGLNDVVIGVGSSLAGTAGFDALGVPFFSVFSDFILCDGLGATGSKGSQTGVAASNSQGTCGGFNGALFFTAPSPFYSLDFASAIPAGPTNFGTGNAGPPPNIELDAIGAKLNFLPVPEPATLMLFGFGLLGTGAVARRRRKSRA